MIESLSADSRALLVGADGMLGRAMAAELDRAGVPFIPVLFPPFDLTSDASVARTLAEAGCGLVINCAAWTDVDGAESREGEATEVNAHGARRLAEGCRASGALLLHYSTDYVFDGAGTVPYPPHKPRSPLNAYGRSKALGEEMIIASGCRYLIVRTSWLYAPWGNNFVLTIANRCGLMDRLRVVNDQRGRPTSAESLARRSLTLAQRSLAGEISADATPHIYHMTDGGECTWWELASFIADTMGSTTSIVPCTSSEFPRRARRPLYSVLDITETEALLGPAPGWKDEVKRILACRSKFTQ